MQTTGDPGQPSSPVEAARVAIWRLFQEGYVDEDMATAGLLAVDLGTRRTHHRWAPNGEHQPHRRTAPIGQAHRVSDRARRAA